MTQRSIHWFRKGLRLHDNPALIEATKDGAELWPIFILDPWFVKNARVGANRWRFLAQTLKDLDDSFKKLNGRLYVVRGDPLTVLPRLFDKWNITRLTFEEDTEPYAKQRDEKVRELARDHSVDVVTFASNTLFPTERVIKKNGGVPPKTYQSFLGVLSKLGSPDKPCPVLSKDNLESVSLPLAADYDQQYQPPSLEDLGVGSDDCGATLFPGGESQALARMDKYLKRTSWICSFEKPKTEPNSLEPSTTVLSPYIKFGCLSVKTFYWELKAIYNTKKTYSKPPVSLEGQLLWREFFYTVGTATPNFDRMEGNSLCRQIPWDVNEEYLQAWKSGKTGYPFIDAIMTQLRTEGWIHHLARHSVACFLTRGDLYVSWEEGMKVFEEYLLDADWSLNAGNWMWLSASAFFHQYYRVYSPVAFGKKTDKRGEYIKKYLPLLKKFPEQYIYEPWKAPLSVQKAAGCIIGQDYPKRIVDHDTIHKTNIQRMKAAYSAGKEENEKTEVKTGKRKSDSSTSSSKKKK